MRFPMTMGRAVAAVTALVVVMFVALLFLPFGLQQARVPLFAVLIVPFALGVSLALTVLWAPRAVRLEGDALLVERLAWPAYRIPLHSIAFAEPGPELRFAQGAVRRVAGNGGLMGFTGWFWVDGVGLTRVWATQLGTPTLVLRRHGARPILLGVDDAPGLTAALKGRVPCASH